MIFLVVALHCRDRFAWATCTDAHFYHFAVKEVGEVLLIDIGCDAGDVQASRLPGQAWLAAYAHSKCLDGIGGGRPGIPRMGGT